MWKAICFGTECNQTSAVPRLTTDGVRADSVFANTRQILNAPYGRPAFVDITQIALVIFILRWKNGAGYKVRTRDPLITN